jgi:hypothetical protein
VVDWWVRPTAVSVDEPVTVGVTLRNRYWAGQTIAVEVLVDGETVEREYVRVPGEGRTDATFERRFERPGSYRVGVGGQGTRRVGVTGAATPTRATRTETEGTADPTETPRREAAAFAGRVPLVVAAVAAVMLAFLGARIRRNVRPP